MLISFGERGNGFLKFFDRWLGIPVVFILSFFKRQSSTPLPQPKRIGLLIPAAIGDTIVASSAFSVLRERFPRAEIIAFGSSTNMAIFPLLKGLSKVIKLPVKNPLKARAILRDEGRFDWWIDFGQWARLNAVYSYFASADFKVGFQTEGQARHYVYDAVALHSNQEHELENFRRLLEPLGLREIPRPHIDLMEAISPKNQVVIHMFAGGTKPHLKEWPFENWSALISELTSRGLQVVLSGVREDRPKIDELLKTLKDPAKVLNAAGAWNLETLAKELKSSRAVVSVNTGIMHLAAALDCNLVSLQGPTSVKRWGPTNENSVGIQSPRACSPCLNLGFDYGCPYNYCMQEISVRTVTEALNRFLPS